MMHHQVKATIIYFLTLLWNQSQMLHNVELSNFLDSFLNHRIRRFESLLESSASKDSVGGLRQQVDQLVFLVYYRLFLGGEKNGYVTANEQFGGRDLSHGIIHAQSQAVDISKVKSSK